LQVFICFHSRNVLDEKCLTCLAEGINDHERCPVETVCFISNTRDNAGMPFMSTVFVNGSVEARIAHVAASHG
jgi:hypothetical protein